MPTIHAKNLVLRHNTWVVRLRVPDDVSAHLGKSILSKSTGESDLLLAYQVAEPILQAFRGQIEKARKSISNGPQTAPKASIGWLDHLSDWMASTSLQGRQRDQYASDIRQAPWLTVEGCTRVAVQRWVSGQTVSPKTVRRKLSAYRTYWRSMRSHGLTETPHPFADLILASPKSISKRDAFGPAEVVRLWIAADGPLRDLIMLAAHTGARIEELCQLRTSDIESNCLMIRDSKTQAGIRAVPIHSAIADLVHRLVDQAQDGWLIPSTADNQYGERSVPHSKRFGRLKSKLGFPPTKVFHSVRKTVATMFQDAGCPEHIAADILGHEIQTMTYGVYSKGSGIETRRQWMERAIKY